MELGNGSIVQDGMTFREAPSNPAEASQHIPYPVTGQVRAVYYIDDDDNRDGETIVCDVHCAQLGIDLFKVPYLYDHASVDNYSYHSPRPHAKNVDGSAFDQLRIDPRVGDGDTVLIVFANGNVHQPYIIKTLPSPQTGFTGKSPSPMPKRSDGYKYKKRVNGTNFSIDNDGNVLFENTATLDSSIPLNKKFTIRLKDPAGRILEYLIDTESKLVQIRNVDSGDEGVRFVLDGTTGEEKVVLASKGNVIVLDDTSGSELVHIMHKTGALFQIDQDGTVKIVGKEAGYIQLDNVTGGVTVTNKDGHSVILDDTGVKISSADGKQIISVTNDGKVEAVSDVSQTFSSPKGTLNYGSTNIGSFALFNAVLGPQLSAYLTPIATALGQPPPATLTGTPLDILAMYVKLKGNLL